MLQNSVAGKRMRGTQLAERVTLQRIENNNWANFLHYPQSAFEKS